MNGNVLSHVRLLIWLKVIDIRKPFERIDNSFMKKTELFL